MNSIWTKQQGKLLIVLTLIVSLVGLVGCSDDDSGPKKFDISGTVVSNDGQALAGIKVVVVNEGTSTGTVDGEWNLTGIKKGAEIKAVDPSDTYTFDDVYKVTADDTDVEFKANENKETETDPNPDEGTLKVKSATAVDKNTIEIEFSDTIDAVEADNFVVPSAEVDTVELEENKVTINLKNFIPNNVSVFFKDITAGGEAVELAPTGVNTENVEIPHLKLSAEKDVVALDPNTDTASVELTTELVNFPEGAEATIEFGTNAEVSQISREETTSEQEKTIRLVVSDLTEKKQIKVTATIKEVKNSKTGELFNDYKENVAAVDKTVTFSPNIDDVEDPDTHSFRLKKAITTQADRLTVWVNKEVTEGLVNHLNSNPGRILVDDNLNDDNDESYIPVERVVKAGTDKLLVILDAGEPGNRNNFPLDDKVTHRVQFDGDYNNSYVLNGSDEFFLGDANYLTLTDVYTSQTDESLSDNQLKVVFSEAVNNLTSVDEDNAARYSVQNLENWVIGGTNLGNDLPSQMSTTFPDDVDLDVEVEVTHSNEDKLTRDVVILTFNPPTGSTDSDRFENMQSFLSEGPHTLQINTIGDWASVTDSANMVSTLEDEYDGIPTSDITAKWYADSPEQFVVEFSGTVQDDDGAIDEDNFEIIVPDKDAASDNYGAHAFAKLTAGEQNSDSLPTEDFTTADDNEINDAFTVTELDEGEKYLIELNYDWTQLYDTENTENNYHMSRFNPLRLKVKGLKDSFGYDLADDENGLTVSSDIELTGVEDSEIFKDYEVLTTVKKDQSESDLLTESDYTILDDENNTVRVSRDAGAVKLNFQRPIQVKDQNGEQHVGSTILTTPSQQQASSANGGVKEVTFEYINQDTGSTVEGTVAKVAARDNLEQARDYSIIVVPIDEDGTGEEVLEDGTWKLVVRDITDDVGNAMGTEKIEDIEITTASDDDDTEPTPNPDKPFDLIKVDAHYNVTEWLVDEYDEDLVNTDDAKDIIHVQFNKPVALTGVATPLKKSNWRLNSEPLPVEGTRIERGILGETAEMDIDNDGIEEDLDKTQYAITIILPDGYLDGQNNNHSLTIIDVEDTDGETLSERVIMEYVDETNGDAFTH